jgi:eukaryotic-like serine/threonine-protein kinase
MLSDNILHHLREVSELPHLPGERYQIGQQLGRGGMGIVYLAHDSQLGREVAMKVLTIADEDDTAAERMRREARILAKIEHPGIVPIHDAGTLADGRVYYTMKLVRGQRLDRHSQAVHSLADALRLFQRICEPIAFAHSQAIVHRDLKPENIMVGQFGEVLVLDWGVALVLNEAEPDGPIIGTKRYMAPEQAAGANGEIDGRTDIYALGRILSLLLSPHEPIAKPLKSITEKATNSVKTARYSTALELSEDIGRYLDGRPVSAHPESILDRTRRVLSHNKTLAALILAYLAMRILLFLFPRN